MEKRTWAKLVVTIVVIGGIGAGIYRQWYWGKDGGGVEVVWGSGRPSEAEKSYYKSRIDRIIRNWQDSRRSAERGDKGLFKDSYNTLLVFDSSANAFWIEEGGTVQAENHVELPSNMEWRFYRITSEGGGELPGQTRLKLRGYNSSQQFGEQFHIVGTGRGIGYIDYHFGAHGRGSGSGSGRFTLPTYSYSRDGTEDLYPSLVLTEAEYAEYLKASASSDPNGSPGGDPEDESELAKNKASWARAEKLLYQRIEKEMLGGGYSLHRIEVGVGPDFSAGHARIDLRQESALRGIFGGGYWGDVFLKFDLLGDDIWYVADAVDPRMPSPPPSRRRGIDVEFLMCSRGEIPESKRSELIEKGREIQKPQAAVMPSKWKARLPNGAIVQFIGICENPSAGRQWWGPDGLPIDYVPYYNAEAYSDHEDRNTYDMAWGVEFPKTPNGSSGGGTSGGLEGTIGSYGGSMRDRYGNRLYGNLRTGGYSFDKSRKKTALKLKVRVGEGDYERVEIRNISLVRGKDQGVEIEVIPRNPPSKWTVALSNGAVVELRGVCEMPNEGKKWWGADGTILEYPPMYSTSSSRRAGKNKKRYQMTWSVLSPTEEGLNDSQDVKF
ncbi:MAG: hypothetical protein ACYS8Z_23360, partial [Planctomycetota bacterium]